MAGDYLALKAELQKPDLAGLTHASAAAKLRADVVTELVPGSFAQQAGILSILGLTDGVTAMEALKAAAQQDVGLSYVVAILQGIGTTSGIDFGDPEVRATLDQLEAAEVLQPAWVAKLKAYGQRTRTRDVALAGWELPVTEADVARARSL